MIKLRGCRTIFMGRRIDENPALQSLRSALFLLGGLACVVLASGCQGSKSEAIDQLAKQIQAKILVAGKPDQVQSLKSVYGSYQPDQVVTVAGRIYAESISPFDPLESTFTVIELPKPGHNHEDPGDCPFCKRELRNAKFAIVKIVDEAGKTLPAPADQLLGLEKNQDVVLTGSVNSVGETLVLQVQQLHILSKDDAQSLSEAFHGEPNQADSDQT